MHERGKNQRFLDKLGMTGIAFTVIVMNIYLNKAILNKGG